MADLRSLNQQFTPQYQHPFWDWVNNFDQPNTSQEDFIAGARGWGSQGNPHEPHHHHHDQYHDHPTPSRAQPTSAEENSTAPDPPEESPGPGPTRPTHEHGHGHGRGHGHAGPHRGRGGGPGGRGRGGWGGRGRGGWGRGDEPPPFAGFRGPFGGLGGFGGPGGPGGPDGPSGPGGPGSPPFDLPTLARWVQETFITPTHPSSGQSSASEHTARDTHTQRPSNNTSGQDFTPTLDLFNTREAYIAHLSLPGALKEDVAVTWDAGSSSLVVSGIVCRPWYQGLDHQPGKNNGARETLSDEDFFKTMELGERKEVGAFERKVVLGTKEKPAGVREEEIKAVLEGGVLRVVVPKVMREETEGAEGEGWEEVRRVDVE